MRLETGSNSPINNKKVSIQVKLGGLSFSAHEVTLANSFDEIELIVDTPRVTLAPREEVSSDNASEILRLAGKVCHRNEQGVCSSLNSDIVAIIAIDRNALASIVAQWGERAYFTSPLLDMRHSEERCLTIDSSDKVCYIRYFDGGLLRAEAFDAITAEDILHAIHCWIGDFKDIPIYIKSNSEAIDLLRKYYKSVICE